MLGAALGAGALLGTAALAWAAVRVGPISVVSRFCPRQNAEVEAAADRHGGYVYELWIGCGGIGFSRSTDRGRHFSRPFRVPGSGNQAWDPTLAVAPDGTLYAAFMVARDHRYFPVVDASFNHGRSFSQTTKLIPPPTKNWGDRPFLAAGPGGRVYLSWDYGPSRRSVKYICPKHGSCAFATGDLNVVVQRSSNHGRTFGRIIHVSPGFPASGGDSAPMVVEPSGRIDLLYQGYHVTNRKRYSLAPAYEYFTASTDGGLRWSKPVRVGAGGGTMSLAEWWIDGDLGIDAGGNLYATWDTQSPGHDVGWLSVSRDHGRSWSKPIQAPLDRQKGPHIVEVTGGPAGTAYVGWLTYARRPGYALEFRPYSLKLGWLSKPLRVSRAYGNARVWPGDTFGITSLSPTHLVLSWGSATPAFGGRTSEIFAAPVFGR